MHSKHIHPFIPFKKDLSIPLANVRVLHLQWCLCTKDMPGTHRRLQILWNWSLKQSWAATWLLGMEVGFSRRAASVLHSWTILPLCTHTPHLHSFCSIQRNVSSESFKHGSAKNVYQFKDVTLDAVWRRRTWKQLAGAVISQTSSAIVTLCNLYLTLLLSHTG